jgi:hypothetical protein
MNKFVRSDKGSPIFQPPNPQKVIVNKNNQFIDINGNNIFMYLLFGGRKRLFASLLLLLYFLGELTKVEKK